MVLDRELNFKECLFFLWKGKVWIFCSIAVFLFFSIFYLYLAPAIYESRVSVQSPVLSNIFDITKAEEEGSLEIIDVKDIYSVFIRSLKSESAKRSFYKKLIDGSFASSGNSRAQSFEDVSRSIEIKEIFSAREIKEKINGIYSFRKFTISVRANDPEEAERRLSLFLSEVNISATKELLDGVVGEAGLRLRVIREKIAEARQLTKLERMDRIAVIRETLEVMGQGKGIEKGNLERELNVLLNRKDDDPFVPGLRKLQQQYSFYSSFAVNPENVSMFRLDGAIEASRRPVMPESRVVFFVAIMAGIFVGCSIVFFRLSLRSGDL